MTSITANISVIEIPVRNVYGLVTNDVIIHRVRKRLYPFFIFFSRCPVCGEWCKLHWLLLDTASFDWNTRRSRGHKMFKMAPTKQRRHFVLWNTQRQRLLSQFNATFGDSLRSIRRTRTPLSVGMHNSWRQVAYATAKAPGVVFAYSTAQNAFCCLVGAILNILCPRERWVFQSKLGVSSSNQCNLHHSPHTGHLEKKIKGTIFFGHGV